MSSSSASVAASSQEIPTASAIAPRWLSEASGARCARSRQSPAYETTGAVVVSAQPVADQRRVARHQAGGRRPVGRRSLRGVIAEVPALTTRQAFGGPGLWSDAAPAEAQIGSALCLIDQILTGHAVGHMGESHVPGVALLVSRLAARVEPVEDLLNLARPTYVTTIPGHATAAMYQPNVRNSEGVTDATRNHLAKSAQESNRR